MPATRILKQAAKARMNPRDWLLQQLNELQSQHKVAISLGESPAAISRALAEYRIMEVKNYVYRGRHHKVVRAWVRAEDLLRRKDWQEWS